MKVIRGVEKIGLKDEVADKKIVCFGAGKWFWEAIDNLDIYSSIALVIDNSEQKIGKKIEVNGYIYSIYSPEILKNLDIEKYVMIITTKYYKSVVEQCGKIERLSELPIYLYSDLRWRDDLRHRALEQYRQLSLHKGISIQDIQHGLDNMKSRMESKADYTIIPKLNFIVTEKCSLRCRDCRALIPHIQNPGEVSFEELKEEIDTVMNAIDELVDAEPIGGEPFLYSFLPEVVDYLAGNKKIDNVVITTNGTIVPNERLTMALMNKKVMVYISDYGYVDKMAKLVRHFELNGIAFQTETDMQWMDVGGVEYRNRNKEELKEEYMDCYCQYLVKYIWDRKIWLCPRAPRLSSLGIICDEHDYEVLSKNEQPQVTRKKILDSFEVDYAEACNYCDQGNVDIKYIKAGVQINEKVSGSEYTLIKRSEYEELLQIKRNRYYVL